jgi:hypothetical protein
MSKLAEYLKDWAAVLGEANTPIFRGLVKGSVVLRATVNPQCKTEVRSRLLAIKLHTDPAAAKFVEKLNSAMARDAFQGTILDGSGAVIVDLTDQGKDAAKQVEHIIPDSGTIDGVVVGIQGVDDTVHIRIQESNGATFSVALRDLGMARRFAAHFRGDPVRVAVHGTWKRTSSGVWEPHHLTADSFEELDQSSAKDVMDKLRAIPDNGWASMADPVGFWKDLRGVE